MKQRVRSITVLALLSVVLLSACSGQSIFSSVGASLPALTQTLAQSAQPQVTAQPTVPQPVQGAAVPQSEAIAAFQGTLESIYQNVNPSVVNIRILQSATGMEGLMPGNQDLPEMPFNFPFPFNDPGNQDQQGQQAPEQQSPEQQAPDQSTPQYNQGAGSGFVWDQAGHIVTNNHVVDGAEKVEVTFSDGTTVPATVVGKDVNTDLAVIKVDVSADKLRPIQLADSTQVKVGQLAVAIGNPFGLEGTMTVGIISSMGRTLPVAEGTQARQSYSIPNIIQTDAPINPGNSGGVLVDSQGALIGVTAAIESPVRANAGIGFAIPSVTVQKVVPELIAKGSYEHPWIGISAMDLTPDLAKAMNLNADQRGALVEEVVAGGPAEMAGLRASDKQHTLDGQNVKIGGDVIVAVDGTPIKGMSELIAYLADHTSVGQQIVVSVLRDSQKTDVDLTLGKRPGAEENKAVAQTQPGKNQPNAWLGIRGADVTAGLAEAAKLPSDVKGVLVQQVENNSPAEKAGLRGGTESVTVNGEQVMVGGDVITAIDGQAVSGIQSLRNILAKHNSGDNVSLEVLRDGQLVALQVTLASYPNPGQ